MPLQEDNEEGIKKEDNKDVLMKLSTLIVTGVDDGGLSTVYISVGNRIVYDEV